MQCPKCMTTLQETAVYCNSCGEVVAARVNSQIVSSVSRASGLGVGTGETGISIDGPQEDRTASETIISGTTISIDGPQPSTEDRQKKPAFDRPKEPLRPAGWRPKKNNVKAWATTRELNHYEVLELGETAADELVQERMNALAHEISNYKTDLDGALQELGTNGRKRLSEMKTSFADRDRYNEEAKQERHQREVEKIRTLAKKAVENDRVLQWKEWLNLQDQAKNEGVSPEELEQIIRALKEEGALTGTNVSGKEVRTINEMKDACAGRGSRLVEAMWNGELERWLDLACERANLAEDIKRLKIDYEKNKRLGAQIFLWKIYEDRLVLNGPAGEVELRSLQEWMDGVQGKGLADASSEALESGALEEWLKIVLKRDDLAALATKAKGQRESGLSKLLEQIRSGATGQPSIKPFKTKHGEIFSLPELIRLCDSHPEDAQNYLFEGLMAPWLVGTLGEADLAKTAQDLGKTHSSKQKKGLELFARELCKVGNSNPYPQIIAEPAAIRLEQIPMGATATGTIVLENKARGYAWGDVAIEPELPGMTMTSSFDGLDARIEIDIDSVQVIPGIYKANVVVRAEGVPTPCIIPIQYEVLPLTVNINPSVLDMGPIPHGKSRAVSVRVSCAPTGGRMLGRARITSPASGLRVTKSVDGESCELRVTLDTSALEAGRRYKTSMAIDLNAGAFQIPIEFQTQLRWDIVAMWTAGISIGTGLLMLLSRYALAAGGYALRGGEGRLSSWLYYGDHQDTDVLVPCGAIAAVALAIIAVIIISRRRKKSSLPGETKPTSMDEAPNDYSWDER